MKTLLVLVLLGSLGCDRANAAAVAEEAGASPVVAPAPAPAPPASPFDKVKAATSVAAAIAIAKPSMEDTLEKTDDGSLLLLAWSAKSMRWSDVGVTTDETSHALTMKDSDEERGKRLCASGNIIEIAVQKTDFGKVHEGLLSTDAGNLYRVMGVGSSGSLVERSRARFCGVVTGKLDYSNSGGGTGHAVKLVGMFDLPENRAGAAVAPPAAKPAAPQPAPTTDRNAAGRARMKQCCSALAAEGRRNPSSAEGQSATNAAAQCSAIEATLPPNGAAPENGAIRTLLGGRNVPAVCAGF